MGEYLAVVKNNFFSGENKQTNEQQQKNSIFFQVLLHKWKVDYG